MPSDTFLRDVRSGVRLLRRSPGLAAAAILSLAVGTGASVALFSLANVFFLRPLPGRHADRLVKMFTSDGSGPLYGATSYLDFADIRLRTRAFEDAFVHGSITTSLNDRGVVTPVSAALVSSSFFDVLGIPPARGRTFTPGDDRVTATRPIVISDRLWRRRFDSDPGIVGRMLTLNGHPFTIAGVAPAGFSGISFDHPSELWAPVSAARELGIEPTIRERRDRFFTVLGRLAPGVSLAQAQAALEATAVQLFAEYPDAWRNEAGTRRTFTVLPELRARLAAESPAALTAIGAALVGVILLVLGITCANVATMLLARAVSRRREIAVRLALGAGRGRLIAQLLTENLVLASLGSACGVTLAAWALATLNRVHPFGAAPVSFVIDWRVLVFAVGATGVTVLLFGLAPALQAMRANVCAALHDRPVVLARRTLRLNLRDALVIAQMAASLALVTVAVLLARTVMRTQADDPGFRRQGVLLAAVDLSTRQYDETRGRQFYRRIIEGLGAIPSVRVATMALIVPLSGSSTTVTVRGDERDSGLMAQVDANIVGPSYFEAMGIRMRRGRDFTDADRDGAPRVAIVTEALARRFWPDQDPIGRRILETDASAAPAIVVGVVADSAYRSLSDRGRGLVYWPALQTFSPRMILHVVTDNPGGIASEIERAVHAVDPELAVASIRTLDAQLAAAREPEQIGGAVAGAAGGLELGLTALALYGVMAYSVTQRTREIGIRIALGATSRDIRRLVGRDGLRLTSLGMGTGLLAAAASAHIASAMFVDLVPVDPVSFAGVAVFCLFAAAAATCVPARRATRIHPVEALRHD